MQEGSAMAIDSAIRVIGALVQEFTVKGHPQEANGASAAMALLKKFRVDQGELYTSPSDISGE
jgi:hypothetical protein